MFEKLADIEARYNELERLMGDPEIAQDYEKVAEYAQERSGLQEIVDAFQEYRRQQQQLEDARQMLAEEDDAELRAMADEEITELEASSEKLAADLKTLEAMTAAAFGKRRKMLRSALKEIAAARGTDAETLLASAGISPQARAEELDVAQFCALARAFAAS